jgi:hypothetical protein
VKKKKLKKKLRRRLKKKVELYYLVGKKRWKLKRFESRKEAEKYGEKQRLKTYYILGD